MKEQFVWGLQKTLSPAPPPARRRGILCGRCLMVLARPKSNKERKHLLKILRCPKCG